MFEDFVHKKDRERAIRWASSVLAACLFVAAIAAVAVAATNQPPEPMAEDEVVVEFAPPPEEVEPEEVEAEPIPIEEPVVAPRPRIVRTEIVVPTEIQEELEESDADLTDDGPSGPQTGRTGRAGSAGTGHVEPPPPPTPPPPPRPRPGGPVQLPENAIPAERIGPLPRLAYPPRAQDEGVQALVIVKCAIALSGEPVRCTVLRGHEMFNASALAWVQEQRFIPAHLPDGTQIVQWKIFPVRFRLTNLP
jgi:TonB family protein